MKALLLGGTGMIGQGVLLECLQHPDVQVVAIGRTPLEQRHERLTQLKRDDLTDYTGCDEALTGVDAVFFCLGASSSGMSEADYRRVTIELPMALAKAVERLSPQATYCFISGQGSDASNSTMWARVKGEAENALRGTKLKAVYCFRPGFIQPMDGILSKTPSYRVLYKVMTPFFPLLKMLPKYATTTRVLGRAMVKAARHGAPKAILESTDINQLAAG